MNPIACLLLGPIAGLAADAAGALVVSDRSEVDLRKVIPGPGVTSTRSTALDLQTAPQATFQLTWPEVNVALGYGAAIAAINVLDENRTAAQKDLAIIHSANLALGWSASSDLQFTAAFGASYGKRHFLGLTPTLDLTVRPPTGGTAPPPPPPTQGPVVAYVPLTDAILKVGAIRGTLGATYRFDGQWTGTAAAYYEVTGGVDDQAQRFLPRQHGPGVTLGATYQIDGQDSLITTVAGSDVQVPFRGSEYQTAIVTEVWAHKWSLQTSGTIGGGFTSQRYRPFTGYTWGTSTLPNANASITHTLGLEQGSTLNLSAASGVGTGYNAVTGQVLYSVTAVASAAWTYESFGATAALTYAQSLHLRETDPDTARTVGAAIMGTYTPAPFIDFQIGARENWQVVPNVGFDSDTAQWVIFAALGLRAPPLLF